ncbi:E2 domain-associated cysteine-rich protein [uncultured Agrobacterium sp.]|uniref:E2 domain-associated cysteine-rich protein n=1 Tax=uncultured Agrobacterium sp. TaxID=157277 RepID=UPI00342ACFF7
MISATAILAANAPSWFEVERQGHQKLIGVAKVPQTPWAGGGLRLSIDGVRSPHVGEETPGTALPARCPERHLQEDRTFCVGLRRLEVDGPDAADRWWEQLRQWIRCQGVAERTGVWPPNQALDHGEAGVHHERALELARSIGLEEEYAAAWLGEPSWITDPDLRIVDRRGGPSNGRVPCPRGCRRLASRNAPILRRKCARRGEIARLVWLERLRRKSLDEYWRHVRASGTKCCGTMLTCPLRDDQGGTPKEEGGSPH